MPERGGILTSRLGALAAGMRARGARVGLGELVDAHRALAAVDPADPRDARLALRLALCSRREDLAAFDAAVAALLPAEPAAPADTPPPGPAPEAAALPRAPLGDRGTPPRPGDPPVPVPAAWSAEELLRVKDFAAYTDADVAAARRLVALLAQRGPMRRSRRTRPSRRRGHAPDLRRTIRAALRYAGEPVDRRWRMRVEKPRPLVLVCDVSGSMAPYARMLLAYLQAAVAARRRVEAFAFGTRLTRITHELRGRDPDAAVRRAASAVVDFAGGTRIGPALGELNRSHGRRLGRGAVVVILSDGWDRGDPDELAVEMARLRRSAQRLIWLNPLAAHPGYEPLTRGMRAALPHADRLLPGNSIASLEAVAEILEEDER